MTRRVPINVDIEKKIRAVSEGIDLDKISVFETIAVTNEPVNKPGSIWEGGVLKDSLLAEMRDYIAAGNAVPLIELHEERLPVGKVFDAKIVTDEEKTSLHALFYVPKDSQFDESIELGILEAVSIGVMPKKMLCSECGWDYLGEDSTFSNFWERTCENGHVIGEDGVHIVAEGLSQWRELSLVMKGASAKAKILPKSKQVIGKEVEKEWLNNPLAAASNLEAEVFMLTATRRETKMSEQTKKTQPEAASEASAEKALLSELTAANVELKANEIVMKKENVELSAKLADTQKELSEVKASLSSKVDKAELDKAIKFLQEEAKTAFTVSGQNKEIPNELEALIAVFAESRKLLVKNFPVDGVAQTNSEKEGKKDVVTSLSAYTNRK